MADPNKTQPAFASVPVNPSPKTRFMQSPDNVSKHKALVDSREFQRGCDFSLLQYQAALSQQPADFQAGAGNYFKLLGAQEFIQTFKLLAESPQLPKVVDRDNLTQS